MASFLYACTPAVRPTPPADFSASPPAELLQLFLERERAMSPVVVSFDGEVLVEDEKPRRLRGFAGYTNCGSMRVKLVGAVGFTLLDYVNVAGTATLVLDKLTPEGDVEAQQGLLHLMQVFTLAWTKRCAASGRFKLVSQGGAHVVYSVTSHKGPVLVFTLDRKKAVPMQQTVTGEMFPGSTIQYGGYEAVGEFMLPREIAIRTEDSPVAVELEISQWRINVDLPAGFFAVD